MAATELWIATFDTHTATRARKPDSQPRRSHDAGRLLPRRRCSRGPSGTPPTEDSPSWRSFRYPTEETDAPFRGTALDTIKKALDYEIAFTNAVGNPYGTRGKASS